LCQGPLEWHYLRTKFHENIPGGSKVLSGGQTDRQTDDLIRFSFLESRLKVKKKQKRIGNKYGELKRERRQQ
jgi:hypothetical protein